MTAPAKLNELNLAEHPARELLERLGWTYVPREELAEERDDERDVLLYGRLTAALLRLNQWMTEDQAQRVIFNLQHLEATGLARNQAVHEYLSRGMPLTVDRGGRQETPTVRFFDFNHPEPRCRPERVRRDDAVPGASRKRARRTSRQRGRPARR